VLFICPFEEFTYDPYQCPPGLLVNGIGIVSPKQKASSPEIIVASGGVSICNEILSTLGQMPLEYA
jgi:hypothetical protein